MEGCLGLWKGSEIFDLFKPPIANFCQPTFERFRLGIWDRLNYSQKTFGIGNISIIKFAISRLYFQLTTNCSQLAVILFESGFKYTPIFSRVWTVRQNLNYIHNRKIPFLVVFVPCPTDFFILK